MKIVLSILSLLVTVVVFGQVVVGSSQYDNLKQSGQLDGVNLLSNPSLFDPAGFTPVFSPPGMSSGNRSACDCYTEPDSSYTLAMQPNDDGSSALINIPFNFCFYGQTYNSFYINNNGNITFTNILSSFSSTAFPSANNQIIAPFWADVDTRSGNGQVLYKVTPTAVYINWEDVGYYNQQGDKLNTFQLIITDGADPVVNQGNVAFCYQDMQWTTGSASQGVNGFGGIPATCGANKGDNIGYFLISQFDHPGVDFDGALGNPDGISWLDYKSFYFDLCNTSNVPPIPEGISSCDTFKVCSFGDTADISISFLSPEVTQSTSITYNNGGLTTLQQVSNVPGNTAELILRIIGDPASAGTYDITVTATDNFAPTPGVTTINFVILIEDSPVVIDPVLTPTEGCDSVLVNVLNGPFDTYLWDDSANDSTNWVSQSGPNGVTVSVNGCYKRVEEDFNIATAPVFNLQGNLSVCPGLTADVYIPDSLNLDSVTWNLGNIALDSLFSNSLSAGNYNVSIWDSSGYCQADTSFTVVEAVESTVFTGDTLCSGTTTYQVAGLGNPSGTWYSSSPQLTFSDINAVNPMLTALTPGTYDISYLDNCNTGDTATLIFVELPTIFSDTSLCQSDFQIVGTSVYPENGSWSEPTGNVSFSPSATTLNPLATASTSGIYTVTYTDDLCGNTASADIEFISPPQIFGDTLACNYNMLVTGTQAYAGGIWTASDTTVHFDDSSSLNPFIEINVPGIYTVTFTDDVCNMAVSADIVFPSYVFVALPDTTVCLGTEIDLLAFENGAGTDFVWDTGETGLTITVSEPGSYSITGSNICHSWTATSILDNKLCDISVPNIISLSSQSGNNVWFVQQEGIAEYDCVITNRWGNIVYESTNPAGQWDGNTPNGTRVEEGTYFYTIKAALDNGEPLVKQGFVQVVH
ncbi:MAG: nidogen-like domain-containing protein [Crocinitomicaceae bacterium]